MFLDDEELKDLAKISILLKDFFDNIDKDKKVFTKEELEEMNNVYRIVESNEKIRKSIESIYEIRKYSSIKTSDMKRNILSRLFLAADISNSYMNLSKDVYVDFDVLSGELMPNEDVVKVRILEKPSFVSNARVRFMLEEKNIIQKGCKVLILFENNDIIIFDATEETTFYEGRVVKTF